MFWHLFFCTVLILIIAVLAVKLVLQNRAMDEIGRQLCEKLEQDTNTLISVSGNNRHLKHLASTLNAQLRALRNARRSFEDGDFRLKEAITNISHDLRTPLTAISGYLELLKQEEKTENSSRYLAVIEDRTDALKRLTEEFFSYALSKATSDFVANEKVDLNSILESSISAYYAALKGCGIVPGITIPDYKIYRMLDKMAAARIFGNVISNAIKYSGGDLKIVLFETGEISFSNVAPELDEVQTGKLFERFYTVRDANKSTGLGLSIAKELTEQMHGSISAQYQNGRLEIKIEFFP